MNQIAYFQNIRKEILDILSKASHEIKIAMAWFTNDILMDALIERLEKNVNVELILLDDEINHSLGADFNKYIQKGGGLFLYPKTDKFMHNKFCIVDNEIVVTGSYNWTNYAEIRNCENIIITNDNYIIEAYLKEYQNILQALTSCTSFERIPISEINQSYFCAHVADFAQEIYSCHSNASEDLKSALNKKISLCNIEIPQEIIDIKQKNSNTPTMEPQSINYDTSKKTSIIIKDVQNFKFPVSKYNIGFKAKLIDQNMKEGLKVLIPKGQALPYTVTQDSKSANSGDESSMKATCELYYGKTYELSDCKKLDIPLVLNNLPKLKEGEVKFKIIVTLTENGEISVNFVCINTQSGQTGKYTSQDFIEYNIS